MGSVAVGHLRQPVALGDGHQDRHRLQTGSVALGCPRKPVRDQFGHACIHCPILKVNPKMLPRLAKIEKDLLPAPQTGPGRALARRHRGMRSTLAFLRAEQAEAARLAKRPVTDLGTPLPCPADTQ